MIREDRRRRKGGGVIRGGGEAKFRKVLSGDEHRRPYGDHKDHGGD